MKRYHKRNIEFQLHTTYGISLNLASFPISIPTQIQTYMDHIGDMTFGGKKEMSLFEAMVHLYNTYPQIRTIINQGTTQLGLTINEAISKHPGDPFFNTYCVYRPDLLVSESYHDVEISEFEIIVGGISKIGALQFILNQPENIIEHLIQELQTMLACEKISGDIGCIFFSHDAYEVTNFAWVEKKYPRVHVGLTQDISFKDNCVYLHGHKIGAAFIMFEPHKNTVKSTEKEIELVQCWLKKQIILVSPPTTLIDNKIWMYFLQDDTYAKDFISTLGKERYQFLRSSIPKTYLLTPDTIDTHIQKLLENPIPHGRYVVKLPHWFASKKVVFSPTKSTGLHKWHEEIKKLIGMQTLYGPPIMQEFVQTEKIAYDDGRKGNAKFTPFFIHNPYTKRTIHTGTYAYIVPNSLVAHLSRKGMLGII